MDASRRMFLGSLAGGAASVLMGNVAWASGYPSGEVRLFVGFPAEGPVDIAGRLIAPWLAQRLGTPFQVENRPGESGNLATAHVARAMPDGQSLLVCGPVNVINQTLFQDLPFDFSRDIRPVAGISRVPLLVEVHPSVRARSIPELLDLARAEPGRLRVAYAGKGTPQHAGIELFKMMSGVRLTLVPYPGSAPALVDLLAGRVDVMFDPVPSSMPHVRAGHLVPLGLTGTERLKALPGVPLVNEFVPGYEAGSWFGLGAPRGTPAAVVVTLNEAVNAGLASPGIRERLDELGATAMPGTADDFADFIRRETERYARVIREAGMRPG